MTVTVVTSIVALATIAMMFITVVLTERAIRETNRDSVNKLGQIYDELNSINSKQSDFFSWIITYINKTQDALPKITLKREKRHKFLGIEHYYLWVGNTYGRQVLIKIEPKPHDSDGTYQVNGAGDNFFINDYGALMREPDRTVIVTCEGMNGVKYTGQLQLSSITEDITEVELTPTQ